MSIIVGITTLGLTLGVTGIASSDEWVMASHMTRADGVNTTRVLERFAARSECMDTLKVVGLKFVQGGATVSWVDRSLVIHNMGSQKNITAFLICLDKSE